MAETFVRQAPYIEERSEQLLASVFGDPNAERRKDPNTGDNLIYVVLVEPVFLGKYHNIVLLD